MPASTASTGNVQYAAIQPTPRQEPPSGSTRMPLQEYQPKSMLHLPETHVPRPSFSVIDFHTHITIDIDLLSQIADSTRDGTAPVHWNMHPEACLPVMDRKDVRTMVNLTGGYGAGLREVIAGLSQAHPGRFVVFTEPTWVSASDPDYPTFQAEQLEDAHRAGAKGLKVLKTLGLYLREPATGELVRVDDRRFDLMWDTAGALHLPVAIHTSDPEAFFLPVDRFNERWEELNAHPDWSFHEKGFPGNRDLQEARRNVMRRHPRTQFVCAHCGDAEDLSYVMECMDSHPNMSLDIAARIGELGRQPRIARNFFDKYQDRILFGTDACATPSTPQQLFGDELYEIYYRFLETDDEYFDYAPASIPPQGRWRISGIGLPQKVLQKVYWENAARLLGFAT